MLQVFWGTSRCGDPTNQFVPGFVASPKMSFLEAVAEEPSLSFRVAVAEHLGHTSYLHATV